MSSCREGDLLNALNETQASGCCGCRVEPIWGRVDQIDDDDSDDVEAETR